MMSLKSKFTAHEPSVSVQPRLSANALSPRGALQRIGSTICILDEVDSTNLHLLRHAAELPDGAVVATEFQTRGRGRFGRTWLAPRGAGILMSVLLKEPPHSALAPLAAVIGALAAREGVARGSECCPGLRWPNDLIVGGRKLGGVLAESRLPGSDGDASPGLRAIALGIGVNCWQQRGHFPDELADKATSLEMESNRPVIRDAVAAEILAALDRRVSLFSEPAAAVRAIGAEWRANCVDIGQRITLVHEGRPVCGVAVEMTDCGDLVLELPDGRRRRFGAATTTRHP